MSEKKKLKTERYLKIEEEVETKKEREMTKEPFLFSGETARVSTRDRKKNLSSGCDVREKSDPPINPLSNCTHVHTFARY